MKQYLHRQHEELKLTLLHRVIHKTNWKFLFQPFWIRRQVKLLTLNKAHIRCPKILVIFNKFMCSHVISDRHILEPSIPVRMVTHSWDPIFVFGWLASQLTYEPGVWSIQRKWLSRVNSASPSHASVAVSLGNRFLTIHWFSAALQAQCYLIIN